MLYATKSHQSTVVCKQHLSNYVFASMSFGVEVSHVQKLMSSYIEYKSLSVNP